MNRHGIDGIYNHVPTHGAENWTDNILSANETNEALTELYSRKLFNKEWTDYVMDVLTYDNFYYGIPGGTDSDAIIAHKIGYFWDSDGWVHRDTGIVMFPDKEGAESDAFAISIYTDHGAAEFSIAPVAQDLTRTAYDYFN